MYLSRSSGRKALVTMICVVALVPLYESHSFDSWGPTGSSESAESSARPSPGARLSFSVTGYCKGTTTASGANVKTGMAASDPRVLPVGSIVQVDRRDAAVTVVRLGWNPRAISRRVFEGLFGGKKTD